MPNSEEEWLSLARTFENRWNFPNGIGAIDGKRILIQQPFNAGSHYFDYKGNNSIVLMKPYPRSNLANEERVFNYRLSRMRRISENGFGILANMWRVLRAPITLQPKKVVKMTLAILVLHNFLR